MLKNIMTPLVNLKSIFLHQLWLVFVLLYVSLLVAFLSILMILCLPFLVVIWPLAVMLHKEQALASTLEGFVESTAVFVVAKYNILVSFLSLKNLKQRLDVAHKTELEGDQQRHTSQSGTKK